MDSTPRRAGAMAKSPRLIFIPFLLRPRFSEVGLIAFVLRSVSTVSRIIDSRSFPCYERITMKTFPFFVVAPLLVGVTISTFADDPTPKTLSIHRLPTTVQKTVKEELGDSKLVQIEQDQEDGEITYTVTRKVKDEDRYFTIAADGSLSAVEVALDETPPPVQNTIKGQLRDGTLDSIEKTFEGNAINFEVETTTKSGADRSFTVALDGKLTSVQVTIEEIPAPARKTIDEHLGNGKLVDIFRLTEGNEISYDAEVDHDGKVRDVIVSPAGKLESIQVLLAEIPAEAQKTIKEKIGAGKLVRIDQSFTPRHGVLPFEIEARKDGKPFNFSVGPRGRFLGMDE